MSRVYIQNRLHVDLPATKENPGGRVVTLEPGWCELDDELASHPVLAKLTPQTDGGRERQDRLAEAAIKRDETIAQAHSDYSEVLAECQQQEREEYQQASEERAQRIDDANARGVRHNEPHPDPAAQRAQSLTGDPSGHVVPAGSMAQKPEADETRKKEEDALPTEGQQQGKQRERLDDDTSTSSPSPGGSTNTKKEEAAQRKQEAADASKEQTGTEDDETEEDPANPGTRRKRTRG